MLISKYHVISALKSILCRSKPDQYVYYRASKKKVVNEDIECCPLMQYLDDNNKYQTVHIQVMNKTIN